VSVDGDPEGSLLFFSTVADYIWAEQRGEAEQEKKIVQEREQKGQ
jgi:uncharacterized protein (DUF2225 family)